MWQSEEHGYGLSIVPNATVEYWVFIYYCCKLLDFCDTVFMVLGKRTRQFTLLHVWSAHAPVCTARRRRTRHQTPVWGSRRSPQNRFGRSEQR